MKILRIKNRVDSSILLVEADEEWYGMSSVICHFLEGDDKLSFLEILDYETQTHRFN